MQVHAGPEIHTTLRPRDQRDQESKHPLSPADHDPGHSTLAAGEQPPGQTADIAGLIPIVAPVGIGQTGNTGIAHIEAIVRVECVGPDPLIGWGDPCASLPMFGEDQSGQEIGGTEALVGRKAKTGTLRRQALELRHDRLMPADDLR